MPLQLVGSGWGWKAGASAVICEFRDGTKPNLRMYVVCGAVRRPLNNRFGKSATYRLDNFSLMAACAAASVATGIR